MRITSKGQVTIPQGVREQAGLMPGSEVDFIYDGETVRLVKCTGDSKGDIARRIAAFRGSAKTKFTTDELMAMLRGED